MDFLRMISTLVALTLSACSIGTDLHPQHCHVRHQTEIPLNNVPWISPQQQVQEAGSIFPRYLTLKKEQEQAENALNCTIGDDGKN